MNKRAAGRLLLGGSLALLLAACGQNTSPADPYTGGASYPWSYTAPAGQVTPLSLTPGENNLYFEPILAAKNGWGPIEIDRSNGEQRAGDGRTLTLNGKTYPRGFGTHANSELLFSLRGTGATCTRFTADIGVDDEVGNRGSVVFQVYLDGLKAYDSGLVTGASATKKVDLDIGGKQELRLVVITVLGGISYDHADWAIPKIYCQAGGPALPPVTLTSAVKQYDRSSKTFRNYTRFPTLNGRSLPAYYDLNSIGVQGQPATVLCGGDPAVVVSNLSDAAHPNRYRVEVQSRGEHSLKVFLGDRCPGSGEAVLTQTVQGVEPQRMPLGAGGFGFNSLALKADGTVAAWGGNEYGQLGNGNWTPTYSSTPVVVGGLTNIVSIDSGSVHNVALRADGTVVAWGSNGVGQLGNGTTDNSLTPVGVTGLTNVVSIAAGSNHSLALKADGTVAAWGYNGDGNLGTSGESSTTPVAILNLTDVVSIASGALHSLALRADGTVTAWGSNQRGQLGNGQSGPGRGSLGMVKGLTNVVSIAGGGAHSLALRADGTVAAWGDSYDGQLGNGTNGITTDHINTWVGVIGLTDVVSIAGANTHSLAVRADGTAVAWGSNQHGELGNGATISSSTPVAVKGLTEVVYMAGGFFHSLALRADGSVAAWGDNFYGQLGNGTSSSSILPVPTLINGVAQPTP